MRVSLIFAPERRFSPRLNILKQGRPFSLAAGSLAEMDGHFFGGGGGRQQRQQHALPLRRPPPLLQKTRAAREAPGIMNGKQILRRDEQRPLEHKISIIDSKWGEIYVYTQRNSIPSFTPMLRPEEGTHKQRASIPDMKQRKREIEREKTTASHELWKGNVCVVKT